jgi:hypothetical protein
MVEDDEKRRLQRMTRLQLQPLRHLLLQIIQKLMTKNAVTSKAITSLIFYLQQELKKVSFPVWKNEYCFFLLKELIFLFV